MMKKDGFTLPEVLIALTLFAVVTTSLYFHFNTGMFVYGRINRDLGIMTQYRVCFAKFEEELSNAVNISDVESSFKKRTMSFPARVAVYAEGETTYHPAMVSYNYRSNNVYRSVEPLKRDKTKTVKKQKAVVLSGVTNVSFSYAFMTPDKKLEWRDEWDPESDEEMGGDTHRRMVPSGVRMHVREAKAMGKKPSRFDRARLEEVVTKTVYLPIGTVKEVKLGL